MNPSSNSAFFVFFILALQNSPMAAGLPTRHTCKTYGQIRFRSKFPQNLTEFHIWSKRKGRSTEVRELNRAAAAAKIGHLGTHAFRHTYRSWLDAVGTSAGQSHERFFHLIAGPYQS